MKCHTSMSIKVWLDILLLYILLWRYGAGTVPISIAFVLLDLERNKLLEYVGTLVHNDFCRFHLNFFIYMCNVYGIIVVYHTIIGINRSSWQTFLTMKPEPTFSFLETYRYLLKRGSIFVVHYMNQIKTKKIIKFPVSGLTVTIK